MRRKLIVTKAADKKQWNCPQLVRLGRIADVAGTVGTGIEGPQHIRS